MRIFQEVLVIREEWTAKPAATGKVDPLGLIPPILLGRQVAAGAANL